MFTPCYNVFTAKNKTGVMNMTQIQFTLDFEKLKEEVMNAELTDVLKSAIVLMMNQFMEMERNEYIKASAYERNSERQDYRNGYYERDLTLRIGRVTLRVPRTRNGGFDTLAFEKYQRSERALLLSMLEMFVNGVSTRKVNNIVHQLCGENVSKSLVSSLTESLEPKVKAWAERPLNVFVLSIYLYRCDIYKSP